MRTDFYSIVLSSTFVLVANCFKLDRELQNFDQSPLESNERSSRFALFSIVRVTNVPCTGDSGDVGTCYTNSQCRNSNGVASGSCANGFGVCCIVTVTCDAASNLNNTNFRNRDWPSGFTPNGLEVCNLRIVKPSSNVCQVRLDFTNMQLASSDPVSGQCLVDRLNINGISNAAPSNLCGDLSGQHMYLNFGSNDRMTLSLITDGAASPISRQWTTRITYIECNSRNLAPDGCLQYHQAATGEVRMLGYPMAPHLADLDYTVCVRSEDGAGQIVWTPCAGEPPTTSFLLNEAARMDPAMGTPGTNCALDYVMIMTDDNATPATIFSDRYCGNTFATMMAPFMVRSIAKPFIMRVKTNADEEAADMMNTGFCLAFRQEPPRMVGG